MENKRFPGASLVKYVFLLIIAVGYIAICSLSTTPLVKYNYGQDSAFFILVGQGMAKGMLPYRDFYDMKGPYLFFLEYLGQRMAWGRTGAFLIQCICFFVVLIFADKILNKSHPTGRIPVIYSLLLLLPGALVLCYTMNGGNQTEELSLPLLMVSLYFCLNYLKNSEIRLPEEQDHPLGTGFFYGIVFGCMCMIRITNAALVGAILVTISLNLILWGRWKNLFLNGLCFLLGTAAAFLPACLWAAANGILAEMLEQVFLFGVRYSGEIGLWQKFLGLFDYVWPCIFGSLLPIGVLAVYRVRDWKYWMLSLSSLALLLLAAAMGNAYCHYFVLGIPNMVLASCFFVRFSNAARQTPKTRWLRVLLVLLLTVGCIAVQGNLLYRRGIEEIQYAMYCARYGLEESDQYDAVQDIKGHIPQEDWDSVFVYGMSSNSNWYVQADLLPPNRYCDWQEHYITLVPEIGNSLTEWLEYREAKWIVLENGREIQQAAIQAAISENYARAYENEKYLLLTALP